jgi:membrane protein implicated in regulation of membrane protease activity
MLKKWGLWLTVVVNVLGGLSAAPGVGAAPNAGLQAAAIVFVLISVLVIALVVLPSSRRALATSDQPSRVR